MLNFQPVRLRWRENVSLRRFQNRNLLEMDHFRWHGVKDQSRFTRGVLIALNDVSAQARDAIITGKAPCFFVINGHDLTMTLGEVVTLPEFLRKRVRLLAEERRTCSFWGSDAVMALARGSRYR